VLRNLQVPHDPARHHRRRFAAAGIGLADRHAVCWATASRSRWWRVIPGNSLPLAAGLSDTGPAGAVEGPVEGVREVLTAALDVSDPAAVERGFKRLIEARGGLSILVNNAGCRRERAAAAHAEARRCGNACSTSA
jgi:NAD(P)-dependent dehydrogenase (short-subunit alcohol dehydrogenase family)